MPSNQKNKLQHWRGFPAIFVWKAAPMLEFGQNNLLKAWKCNTPIDVDIIRAAGQAKPTALKRSCD